MANETYTVTIPLPPAARKKLYALTGPGRKTKRGAYIAEAIIEKLARDATERARESE